MKKVVVAGLIILLAVGAYWGRGLLPADQLKQDMVVKQVEMYMVIQEVLVAIENGEDNESMWQHANESSYALIMINTIPRDSPLVIPQDTATLFHEVRMQLANIQRMHQNDEDVMETVQTLRGRIDAFLNEMGTVSEIRNEYTPASVLIKRMERAEVIDGIY